MSTRQQLRQLIRQRRNNLSPQAQLEASHLLSEQVQALLKIELNLSTDSNLSLAAYLTNDGEIDTCELINTLKEAHVQLCLPVLHPFRAGYLNFQTVNNKTQWTANKYGIHEPKVSAKDIYIVNNIDVICMPLVAFDLKGNRLGMGGGYYDRTLAQISSSNPVSTTNSKQTPCVKPVLVGLAHDCQQVDELPFESWDVPIDYICTPTQIICCKTPNTICSTK